jgi:hypothetical protein
VADAAAFQSAPAFDPRAFQVGHAALSAASYWLGAPTFGQPNIVVRVSLFVGSYSLASPSSEQPSIGIGDDLLVAPYWLGSPGFGTPSISLPPILIVVDAFNLASPQFATPDASEADPLDAYDYALGAPEFAQPVLGPHRLSADAYALAPPDYALADVGPYQLVVGDFILGSPKFDTPPISSGDDEMPVVTTSTITIPAGERESDVLDTRNGRIVHFTVPGVWYPKANLSFQSSRDGIEFRDVFVDGGDEYLIAANPNTTVMVPTTQPLGYAYIKFRSGRSAAEFLTQEDDCTFSVTIVS